MKKSEMLKVIEEALPYFGGSDKSTLSDRADAAKEILYHIEEAGMLPPETTLDKCEDPDYMFKYDRSNFDSGMDCCIPEYFIVGWDWEDEDEQT